MNFDPQRNHGELEGATHLGRYGTRGEGPYITLHFLVQNGRITKASWQSNGCPSSIACAAMTAQLAAGRTVQEALRLEPDDLVVILGGLPPGKAECCDWAVTALRDALQNSEEL